jgi:hypothetical protein
VDLLKGFPQVQTLVQATFDVICHGLEVSAGEYSLGNLLALLPLAIDQPLPGGYRRRQNRNPHKRLPQKFAVSAQPEPLLAARWRIAAPHNPTVHLEDQRRARPLRDQQPSAANDLGTPISVDGGRSARRR